MDIFHTQQPEFDPSTTLPPHLVNITGFLEYAVDASGQPALKLINPPSDSDQVPLQQRTHYRFLPTGPPPTSQQQQPRHQEPLQLAHHQHHLYGQHQEQQQQHLSLPLHQLQPHHSLKHLQLLHQPQPRQYHQTQHQLPHLSAAAHQKPTVSPQHFCPAPLSNPRFLFPGVMTESDPHDIAAQQEAAKEYQPVHEGPAVGPKTSIDTITNEYAKADPVYVEKTLALPQTYSHYRPVKGDGNCGWRAIGFSYFEKLVEAGDQGQIEGEVARLTSMNQMLGNIGGYTYYDDWADEAIGLLRELASCVNTPAAAHALVSERWNDTAVASGLIYYLRLLAATYLKANAADYDPFVPDGSGIHSYCSQSIELIDREIEQLGIIALVNVLLKPVNFVLEIAYLDRSPGSTVNLYRFPEEANGKDVSALGLIIYLLYRPDHYDILYRPSATNAVPAPTAPVELQVNKVATPSQPTLQITSAYDSLGDFSTGDFGALAMIPGFMPSNLSSMSSLDVPAQPLSCPYEPYNQDRSWMSQMPGPMLNAPVPISVPEKRQPTPLTRPQSTESKSQVSSNSRKRKNSNTVAAVPAPRHPARLPALPPEKTRKNCNFRVSAVQLEYDDNHQADDYKFHMKTTSFKNSVFNRAHYGNPNFHPEEWTPEDEIIDARTGPRPRGPMQLSWV